MNGYAVGHPGIHIDRIHMDKRLCFLSSIILSFFLFLGSSQIPSVVAFLKHNIVLGKCKLTYRLKSTYIYLKSLGNKMSILYVFYSYANEMTYL